MSQFLEERNVGIKKTKIKIINQKYIDEKVLDNKYVSKFLDNEYDNKINDICKHSKIFGIISKIEEILNNDIKPNLYKLGYYIGILSELLPNYFQNVFNKIEIAIINNNYKELRSQIDNISDIINYS